MCNLCISVSANVRIAGNEGTALQREHHQRKLVDGRTDALGGWLQSDGDLHCENDKILSL